MKKKPGPDPDMLNVPLPFKKALEAALKTPPHQQAESKKKRAR
jgi:hypothetical protein